MLLKPKLAGQIAQVAGAGLLDRRRQQEIISNDTVFLQKLLAKVDPTLSARYQESEAFVLQLLRNLEAAATRLSHALFEYNDLRQKHDALLQKIAEKFSYQRLAKMGEITVELANLGQSSADILKHRNVLNKKLSGFAAARVKIVAVLADMVGLITKTKELSEIEGAEGLAYFEVFLKLQTIEKLVREEQEKFETLFEEAEMYGLQIAEYDGLLLEE